MASLKLIAAALVVAALVGAGFTVQSAPADRLLVLDVRAGPYRYLDSFRRGQPGAYVAARASFGTPTGLRAQGNVCRVTWRGAGVTVTLASRPRPCRRANLLEAAWYGLSLHGRGWQNRTGLRVGDTVARVRRLYPKATVERPLGVRWLVLARKRVQELDFIRLAVAVNRNGRVASIEVPATYVY